MSATISAATLLPVHDHNEWDGYNHDPRCMGECRRCGGIHQIPGEPHLSCMFCEDGSCSGCNLYRLEQARERGYAV